MTSHLIIELKNTCVPCVRVFCIVEIFDYKIELPADRNKIDVDGVVQFLYFYLWNFFRFGTMNREAQRNTKKWTKKNTHNLHASLNRNQKSTNKKHRRRTFLSRAHTHKAVVREKHNAQSRNLELESIFFFLHFSTLHDWDVFRSQIDDKHLEFNRIMPALCLLHRKPL